MLPSNGTRSPSDGIDKCRALTISPHPPGVRAWRKYAVIAYHWTIHVPLKLDVNACHEYYGYNKWGNHVVRNELYGCGAVTGFEAEWIDNNRTKFFFRMPIIQINQCVRNAFYTATGIEIIGTTMHEKRQGELGWDEEADSQWSEEDMEWQDGVLVT